MLMCHIASVIVYGQMPISRGTIMANAMTYTDAGYSWVAKQANLKENYYCGGRIVNYPKPPLGCVVDGTNWGMPYCWGGYSTISQHNSAMASTNPVISAGDVCAGSCSGNGAGLSCASGLDCSGFVCRAWGRSDNEKWGTHSDGGIGDDINTTPIKAIFLRQGDVYNDAGDHVRLFSNFWTDNTGNVRAVIIEAGKYFPSMQRVHKTTQVNGSNPEPILLNQSNKEMPGYIARVYNNTPSCGSRPTNITATINANSLVLNWNSQGVIRWDIYWKKHTESKYNVIMNVTTKPYTLSNLDANTDYDIKISSVCQDGTWGISNQVLTATTAQGGPNCNNATPIVKNVPQNGNNNGAGSSVSQYGCVSWNESGPEKIFVYHHTGGNISMTLTQTSGADLDAFFLGSCDPNNCIAYVDQGTEPIPGPLPVGDYYIFVDGYNGAVGSFTLLISSQGGGGGTVPNDNCSGATALSVNSTCINTSGNNTNATPSTPAPSGGCPTEGYRDLWYKFTMPNVLNPQVTIRTTAGLLTDLVMETHYSWSPDCETMTYIVCEDDNTDGNGSLMPVISLQGGAGATVWVRVWGWGGQTGTFGICVLNYYSPNVGGDGGIYTIESPTDGRTGTASTMKSQSCRLQVTGMAIIANIPPMSDYVLTNAIGQIIRQGKSENGNFSIDVSTNGIYFLSVVDPTGEKCVSKVFVH